MDGRCEGIRTIKVLKFATGAVLVVAAAIMLIYSVVDAVHTAKEDDATEGFEALVANVLLVMVFLELAKTLFAYVENEEKHLHAIMEAAFIAVLRQVILIEMIKLGWEYIISISILILALGYTYYKMPKQR